MLESNSIELWTFFFARANSLSTPIFGTNRPPYTNNNNKRGNKWKIFKHTHKKKTQNYTRQNLLKKIMQPIWRAFFCYKKLFLFFPFGFVPFLFNFLRFFLNAFIFIFPYINWTGNISYVDTWKMALKGVEMMTLQ